MSISASIDVKLFEKNISLQEIIESLVSAGWNVTKNDYTSFLPLEDNDMFEWQSKKNMSPDELRRLLKDKQIAREIIGLFIIWQKTDIGGSLLFWPEHNYTSFSMNLSSDRQYIKLNNFCKITDFSWYLEKLLPPLDERFGITSFSCEQYS